MHLATVQQEGPLGLFKGVQATSARAMVVAAAELATYDEVIDLQSKRRQTLTDEMRIMGRVTYRTCTRCCKKIPHTHTHKHTHTHTRHASSPLICAARFGGRHELEFFAFFCIAPPLTDQVFVFAKRTEGLGGMDRPRRRQPQITLREYTLHGDGQPISEYLHTHTHNHSLTHSLTHSHTDSLTYMPSLG